MTLANPGSPGVLGGLEFASPADPSGVNTYYRNFSPRIGLAYSLNDKTVIRAAYGIFYAQGNGNRLDRGWLVQGTTDQSAPVPPTTASRLRLIGTRIPRCRTPLASRRKP